MLKKVTVLALIFLLMGAVQAFAGAVDDLLNEIDPWVEQDTTQIMQFIESHNAATEKMLQESKYWEPTMRDISFLLGIDYIGNPKIDNTGRIYFEMRITGESSALFYVDKAMGFPHQLTPNNWADEGTLISGYSVAPSGDYILVQVNYLGDEMHDIWRFNRDGTFKPLLVNRQERYSLMGIDDDNEDVFYYYIRALGQIHAARYTMSSNAVDTLYYEEGAWFPADYDQGKLLFTRWFSFSETQLAMVDVATQQVTDLSDTTLVYGSEFTKDGQILVFTSALSGEDEFMKFCMLDPARPKKFTLLYDPKMAVDNYIYLKDQDMVVTAANKDGYSQLVGFNMQGSPVNLPDIGIGVIGGQDASDLSANQVGDIVYSFSSPNKPPNAYTFKLGGNQTTQVGYVSTFGFDFSNIDVQVIHYPSKDGFEVPCLMYKPANAKQDGTNPAFVSYHGGPPSQSRPYFQRNLAFALAKGFIILLPNVRGSSGYGPAYERADNMEARPDALNDAEWALDYLIDNNWSTPDKIAIWGASYGGYTVDWLAVKCPEKFACGISQVGVSDPDWTNEHSRNQAFSAGWEREYGPKGSDIVRDVTPIYYAENASKPLLVTAGFNDPRVPPSDPRRFAYVLEKLGKPVWYYEEVAAGHGVSFKQQIIRDFTGYYTFIMDHVMK